MRDKELIKTVTEFRKGFLDGKKSTGMCWTVCSALEGYLSFIGVQVKLIDGLVQRYNHFWLELPDKRIIDPTADQFNFLKLGDKMPEVFLGKKPTYYKITNQKKKLI